MTIEKHDKERLERLKKMGWTFLGMAAATSTTVYLFPNNESNYWLSADGKEGFYVLSALFAFLGLYCLGAISRRGNLT